MVTLVHPFIARTAIAGVVDIWSIPASMDRVQCIPTPNDAYVSTLMIVAIVCFAVIPFLVTSIHLLIAKKTTAHISAGGSFAQMVDAPWCVGLHPDLLLVF